jgi:hypothetical protein
VPAHTGIVNEKARVSASKCNFEQHSRSRKLDWSLLAQIDCDARFRDDLNCEFRRDVEHRAQDRSLYRGSSPFASSRGAQKVGCKLESPTCFCKYRAIRSPLNDNVCRIHGLQRVQESCNFDAGRLSVCLHVPLFAPLETSVREEPFQQLSNHFKAMTKTGSARVRGSRHKHLSIFRPSEETPCDEVIRIDIRFKPRT